LIHPTGRERLSLDQGWRFHLGDIPFPIINGHYPSYDNAKAGKAWGAAAQNYDDKDWRELDLPHDWAVEGAFDSSENISQSYRPRGIGWYRRQFKLDRSDKDRHLELQFDGVATHCTVWVNGNIVHRNWCGYTSFSIDLTPFAQYGDNPNTVALRVDANAMEGWWYEGGGIYRHTWLVKRHPVHLITDGVCAHPIRNSSGSWMLPVEAKLENSGRDTAFATVEVRLIDPEGTEVACASTKTAVAPLEQTVTKLSIQIASPHLWSVDDPALYEVRTSVTSEGKSVDQVSTQCGFRTIRFDADKGFFINDAPLKLKGVCSHQDHAGVGVAVPDSLWEFRVRKLKEMGANAYRCAHNPPAAEFLDACDRQGILVMDENRNFNCSPEYQRQLEWLVNRDRNHPSIILWSVFNEEPMQGTETGYEMVRRMTAVVKRLDTTRPVTAAMNGGHFAPVNVSQVVDVMGFNYAMEAYDRFHEANPTLPLTSSEDTSAFMTRGEYVNDEARHIRDSYDTQCAKWGATQRNAWKEIATRPFVAGTFIWTGFDYRGEPTPYDWPSASSFFGCMDLCGFPKTAFYIHQAQWVESRPILHLVPHWNWPGREGAPIKVMAISNADSVTLSLNGQPIGEKAVDPFEMVSWDIPYAPGRLEAIGKKRGKEVCRHVVETTGEPTTLRLTPDRTALAGDGCDALPITVEALDSKGRPVPTANLSVEFEIEGSGSIIGLGNGDPNCHEPEKGLHRSLFNGLAQVIVQSQSASSGALVLRAKAPGLKAGATTIEILPAAPIPAVSKIEPAFTLDKWLMSPFTTTRPDPNQTIADSDQNSWQPFQPGKLQQFAEGNYAVYRVRFTPYAEVQKFGGQIAFKAIGGKAEVWLDNSLLGKKEHVESAPLRLPFPPGQGERTLSVLIEMQPGSLAGFADAITVESESVLSSGL
jgi:beta-galactosidase